MANSFSSLVSGGGLLQGAKNFLSGWQNRNKGLLNRGNFGESQGTAGMQNNAHPQTTNSQNNSAVITTPSTNSNTGLLRTTTATPTTSDNFRTANPGLQPNAQDTAIMNGANPPLASQTSQNQDLTHPNAIRSEYAAGQVGVPEENAIKNNLLKAGLYYGNKGSAPLEGFNIGGAAQDFQQAQQGLLQSQINSAQPVLNDIQVQRNAAITAAQGGVNATAPIQVSPGTSVISPTTGQSLPGYSASESALRGGAATAIGQQTPEYFAAVGNRQGIKNVEGQLSSLIGANELNPTTIPRLNNFINTVAREGASNPNYQLLNGLVNDIKARYSNYLSGGGATTDNVRNAANELINGNMTGEAITTVLTGLGQAMDNVISGQGSAITAAQNTLNGGGLPSVGNNNAPGGWGWTGQ